MHELLQQRVLPIAVFEHVEDAVPVARALLEGGLSTLELTLRTPVALECLRAIRREVPAMKVGAGTILDPSQVKEVAEAGAYFGVAPGLNPRVIASAKVHHLPFFPGVMTPSEIEHALELGCRIQKYFPAKAAGGLDMLRILAAPYGHTGLKMIPLGGITPDNMADYLSLPLVAAVGGSWLVDKNLVAAKDWAAITQAAQAALAIARTVPRT